MKIHVLEIYIIIKFFFLGKGDLLGLSGNAIRKRSEKLKTILATITKNASRCTSE